jgi:hypothetical protein
LLATVLLFSSLNNGVAQTFATPKILEEIFYNYETRVFINSTLGMTDSAPNSAWEWSNAVFLRLNRSHHHPDAGHAAHKIENALRKLHGLRELSYSEPAPRPVDLPKSQEPLLPLTAGEKTALIILNKDLAWINHAISSSILLGFISFRVSDVNIAPEKAFSELIAKVHQEDLRSLGIYEGLQWAKLPIEGARLKNYGERNVDDILDLVFFKHYANEVGPAYRYAFVPLS